MFYNKVIKCIKYNTDTDHVLFQKAFWKHGIYMYLCIMTGAIPLCTANNQSAFATSYFLRCPPVFY